MSEYLAGQEFPQKVFTNSGLTGEQHMEKAIKRIHAWMEQRFNFGFSEYLSNCYLSENIAPMSNFIEYAKDKASVEKMKKVMDILWFDVALHTLNNRFCAVSSRMYGNNKASNYLGNSLAVCMNKLWGEESLNYILHAEDISAEEKEQMQELLLKEPSSISINFCTMYDRGFYKLPSVIKNIALSHDTAQIKLSSGLSPEDLETENLIGLEPHQIMAQWGAETFTDPQVIQNTLKIVKKYKLGRNSMVFYFKFFNLPILRFANWKKFCEKHEIMPHGISLGRGNVYTYRTKDYIMSTVVNCEPDACGGQEHIWGVNIANNLSFFTTQPARDDENYGSSPGYWIGNGRRPMSVQNKNVNITIYKIPTKKRLMEFRISQMTHAYMSKCFYDILEQEENYIFAQKGNVLLAFISNQKMKFKPFHKESIEPLYKSEGIDAHPKKYQVDSEFDLCQYGGTYHSYITEVSDIQTECFADFKQRIKSNKVAFQNGRVSYASNGTTLQVKYSGEFTVNGKTVETEFKRYDTPYCVAERKDSNIELHDKKEEYNISLSL